MPKMNTMILCGDSYFELKNIVLQIEIYLQ